MVSLIYVDSTSGIITLTEKFLILVSEIKLTDLDMTHIRAMS